MKLSLNWLREYVDVSLPVPELARRLVDATAEVESWETIGAEWDPERIRVARVLGVEPHPNADRLRLVTVDTGSGPQQVVCGAPNVAAGQKVAFATEGAELVDGHTGERAKLKLRPIRGVESAGMVLSEKELGLSDDHEGILVLADDAVVGRALSEQLGDVVFDISTWANRADLLGVLGFAREVAVLTGAGLRLPATTYAESATETGEKVAVSIEAPDLCRRFTASVIEGVRVGPSPAWMQERLQRHGMRPINNVVDITNYVMLETGQPIHAFDYDLVRGRQIVARRARRGERLMTLDGIERELDPDMLMICDGEGPVGVAGIMGGGNSEVSERTTTVLLEIANFSPGSIRRTSGLLKLRTEASLRFEKGIGREIPLGVQQRCLHLFEQLTGGRATRGVVDVFPGKEPATVVTVPRARIGQVLGMEVPDSDVRRILEGLGFAVVARPEGYAVTVPAWRPDVEIADDVVEDIARIYGYDKLPATTLRGSLPLAEPRPVETLRERVRNLAAAVGFQEIISYTLTERAKLERVVDPNDQRRRTPLGVVNPVGAQHTWLRTTLRASVLEAYALNRPLQEGPLRLAEVGAEYLPAEADLPHERPVLCAVLGGERDGRWPGTGGGGLDFFDLKGAVDGILGRLGIVAEYRPAEVFGLLPGHTAEVRCGGEVLGVLGQVHPATAAAFDIDGTVFLADLSIEAMARVLPERPAYTPMTRYPDLRVDLALLADDSVSAGRILQLVRSHRSGNVRVLASVFDEYRGAGLPPGKRSIGVRLRLRATDRTLTDDEASRIQGGLLTRLEKELGVTRR